MSRCTLIVLLAVGLAGSALGCGVAGLTPAPVSMPAARAGLPPQQRFFYDALADDGDWVLIEPYGWVFRPHVNFVAWHPYQSGFWAPSDIYGWTWISAEPFGWATDHYGRWLYDQFEGWVWVPGLDWGPAWVSWSSDNDVVGWAPLPPSGGNWNGVPGGPYLYAPMSQLPSTDLSSHVVKAAQLGAEAARLEHVDNPGEHDGVRFNRGPKMEDVARAMGRPLSPVKIGTRDPLAAAMSPKPAGKGGASSGALGDSIAVMRRAAAAQAKQARDLIESKQDPPQNLPLLRAPHTRGEHGHANPESAAPDSAR